MDPQPRPNLADIPAYVAGKPAPAEAFKLSSNELPFGPLPGVVDAIAEAASRVHRYPDMGSTGLYDALSARFGVPTENLALGTGSISLLYGIIQAFCEPGDEVICAHRSFEAYPIACTVGATRWVPVSLTEDGRHDLPAMAAAVTERTKVVMVCTPNNPTGPAVSQGELDDFLDLIPTDVLVVVDEAYWEFVRIEDPIDTVATVAVRPNVVACRTFSKAHGLAALRVGYAIAPAPIAAALRLVSLPFGISALAQVAATASLAHLDQMRARVDAVVAERARVMAALAHEDLRVPDAQGNFIWLPGAGQEVVDACEAAGVVVRPLGTTQPGGGVRVSIGEPEANTRFLAVLRNSSLRSGLSRHRRCS